MNSTRLPGLLGLFLLALSGVLRLAAQSADTLVTAGRLHLERREWASAELQFSAALTADPLHPTANALLGGVRLLRIVEMPAVSNVLNAAAVSRQGRDLLAWQAGIQVSTNGNPLVDRAFTTTEANQALRDHVLPTLSSVRSNLATAAVPGFQITLSAKETGGDAVTVDQGDLLGLQAGIHLLEFALRTAHPWAVAETLGYIVDLASDGGLTAEELIRQHPEALAFERLEDLAEARAQLLALNARYESASAFIRSRPTNIVRLINLDPDQSETEEQVRLTLRDLAQAVEKATPLTFDTNVVVSLAPFFNGTATFLNTAPRFAGNDIVAGSWPSQDFRGVIPGGHTHTLDARLADLIPMRPQILAPLAMPSGSLLLTARAPGRTKLLLESGRQLTTMNPVEVRHAEAGVAAFLADATGDTAFYRVTDLGTRPTVLVRVVDQATGRPVPDAFLIATVAGRNYSGRSGSNGVVVFLTSSNSGLTSSVTLQLTSTPGYFAAPANVPVTVSDHIEVTYRVRKL